MKKTSNIEAIGNNSANLDFGHYLGSEN